MRSCVADKRWARVVDHLSLGRALLWLAFAVGLELLFFVWVAYVAGTPEDVWEDDDEL